MTKNQKIWPNKLAQNLIDGFSNSELESICSWEQTRKDRLSYKVPPTIYWTAELYSFGKCYREWLKLPKWAPLPFYGDHGVCLNGSLMEHEIRSKPRLHLTWFKGRADSILKNSQKGCLRVPHPWIIYKNKHRISQDLDAKGTIVFYAHSNAGIEVNDYDWFGYFSRLKSFLTNHGPLVLCMHRHDIEKGYHEKAREFGIPIVSAGETSSPLFVDRFYDIVKKFKFATSNFGGSELFYCEDLGVNYFLYGEKPSLYNQSRTDMPKGILQPYDAIAESTGRKKWKLFSDYPPKPNNEKDDFVSDVLARDLNPEVYRKILKRYYMAEVGRHWREIAVFFLRYLRQRYRAG